MELSRKEIKALGDLAKKLLRVETLETRNSDELDFHDVSVWALRDALESAYLLGRLGFGDGLKKANPRLAYLLKQAN